MSFLTSFCDLPQNEQRSVSSVRLTITVGDLLELSIETNYLVITAELPGTSGLVTILR